MFSFRFLRGKLEGGCQKMYPFAHARRLTAVFLGATISGMRHRCRPRSETGWAESPEFGYFKMVAPRALVFRPLMLTVSDILLGLETVNIMDSLAASDLSFLI